MTNNIYPPDHLLRKWEELIIDEEQNVDVVLYEVFQAGADLELEACKLDAAAAYNDALVQHLDSGRQGIANDLSVIQCDCPKCS